MLLLPFVRVGHCHCSCQSLTCFPGCCPTAALQPKTCGDLDPLDLTKNTTFTCATATDYDPSTANVAPPSQENCCKVNSSGVTPIFLHIACMSSC